MTEEKSNQQVHTDVEIKEPSRYNVLFMNDDYTPIDFVQSLLIDIFYHKPDDSEELAKLIHEKGKAIVGTYTYEVAEQKSIESTTMARSAGHPLQVTIEQE